MIELFRKLFDSDPEESTANEAQKVQLAAAALLVECMRADHDITTEERQAFLGAVEHALDVPASEVHALIDQALAAADAATSTYEFTSLINDVYTPAQKAQLIEAMWRVAYADGDLDRYEEHLIRKVAELIYVSHTDFIRLKLAARPDID